MGGFGGECGGGANGLIGVFGGEICPRGGVGVRRVWVRGPALGFPWRFGWLRQAIRFLLVVIVIAKLCPSKARKAPGLVGVVGR